MDNPINRRESEYTLHNEFRDAQGQAHFPPTTLGMGQVDVVRLGKPGGYYPLMGEKKKSKK
jgi:hypothetical protein